MGGSEVSLLELVRGAAPAPCRLAARRRGAARRSACGAGARAGASASSCRCPRRWRASASRRVGGPALPARLLAAGASVLRRRLRGCSASWARRHPHERIQAPRARRADSRRHAPLVWHIHEYVTPRRLSRLLLRQSAGRAAVWWRTRTASARDLAIAVGAALRIETIYNAVDLASFRPGTGRIAPISMPLAGWPPAAAGTVRVGLVATFGRWKGHDVFLRAIAQLDRRAAGPRLRHRRRVVRHRRQPALARGAASA